MIESPLNASGTRSRKGCALADREEMLKRVRQALGKPPAGPTQVPSGLPGVDLSEVMPAIAPGELLTKFESELRQVGGSTHRAASRTELEGIVKQLLSQSQASQVVLSRNPLLGRLGLAERLVAWGVSVTPWPVPGGSEVDAAFRGSFAAASFAASVGITGTDFALAESGSLVVSSLSEGCQLASLAPPVHVALYTRSQLVASLDEVLAKLPIGHEAIQASPGRSVVLITGTSRTADIEQILIRGVHGPREVHAILVEETCLAS